MDQAETQPQISEYEKLRERLSPIVFTLKQLESRQAVINPRIIVHGSTVSGTKSPSDTDILIIFDSLNACPSTASDKEREMYQAMEVKKSAGREIIALDGIDVWPEQTAEFMTAIHRTKETQIADLLINLSALATKMRQEIPGEDMVEIVKYLPSLIFAADPQHQKSFFEQIMGAQPVGWEELYSKRVANFILTGIINIKRTLLEQEVGTGVFLKMYRKIDNQFPDEGNCKDPIQAKATITQLVNFISDFIERYYAYVHGPEIGKKRAAQLRGFYQMYNLGLNFLQACVSNGGVIIYGPNIETDPEIQHLLGLKGKYLFKEDRDLIRISPPRPV